MSDKRSIGKENLVPDHKSGTNSPFSSNNIVVQASSLRTARVQFAIAPETESITNQPTRSP